MLPYRREGRIISKETERRRLKICKLSRKRLQDGGDEVLGALLLALGSANSLRVMESQRRVEALGKAASLCYHI